MLKIIPETSDPKASQSLATSWRTNSIDKITELYLLQFNEQAPLLTNLCYYFIDPGRMNGLVGRSNCELIIYSRFLLNGTIGIWTCDLQIHLNHSSTAPRLVGAKGKNLNNRFIRLSYSDLTI